MGQGHKIFALDHSQQGQDLAVQHFPGADLLFDHVETGLFVVHGDGVLVGKDRDDGTNPEF